MLGDDLIEHSETVHCAFEWCHGVRFEVTWEGPVDVCSEIIGKFAHWSEI